jgi:hypothetical protein
MCIFHKWSDWKQYIYKYNFLITGKPYPESLIGKIYPMYDLRQKRYCSRCNKMEDKLILERVPEDYLS